MKINLRFYCLLLLCMLTLIPGIHKLIGQIPAPWFTGLFKDSIIGKIPNGLLLSYCIIMLLELVCGILFLTSLLTMEFKPDKPMRFGKYAFHLSFILFIVLFSGSFLIENYDNGFKDFLYFVGVLLIYDRCFKE